MINRLVIVLYAMAIGWAVLMFYATGSARSVTYLATFLFLGLPPVVILILARWIGTGRLP